MVDEMIIKTLINIIYVCLFGCKHIIVSSAGMNNTNDDYNGGNVSREMQKLAKLLIGSASIIMHRVGNR